MAEAMQADASMQQQAHANMPVWRQTETLGYHVCGINGCVLADRAGIGCPIRGPGLSRLRGVS